MFITTPTERCSTSIRRVVDQKWTTSTGTVQDEYTYAYDRDSNVLLKRNALQPPIVPLLYGPYDEGYSYDVLNRLTAVARSGSGYQSFTLDALGNMNSVTTGGLTQDRTSNMQNQLITMGAATLTYDHNGNTTTDDQGHTLTYDAWNRLVAAHNGSTLLAAYSYDGLSRRITADTGTATDLYYSGQQDLEERQAGTTTAQTVFSPVYVNAPILRDASGTRVYFSQDANFNVTAVFSVSGSVLQRMVYDSGGTVAFKDASWNDGSNGQNITNLFQGMPYDAAIKWYFAGTVEGRLYSPTMLVWNRPDTGGGTVDGLNLDAFCADNPINRVDPNGTNVYVIERQLEIATALKAAGVILIGAGANIALVNPIFGGSVAWLGAASAYYGKNTWHPIIVVSKGCSAIRDAKRDVIGFTPAASETFDFQSDNKVYNPAYDWTRAKHPVFPSKNYTRFRVKELVPNASRDAAVLAAIKANTPAAHPFNLAAGGRYNCEDWATDVLTAAGVPYANPNPSPFGPAPAPWWIPDRILGRALDKAGY